MGTRVLRAGNWYRPGWVSAACDAQVLGLHAARARGCTSARLCHDQGTGQWQRGRSLGIIVVVRLVPTTRRRCRPERGVDHVARRSNELGVERVQPAAFAPADCSPCPGLPAFAPAQSRVHFVRTVHGNVTGIGDSTGGCNARSVVHLLQRPLIDFYVLVWPELGWSRGVRACYPVGRQVALEPGTGREGACDELWPKRRLTSD